MADKALIFKVAHRKMKRIQPVCAGQLWEPLFIFLGRLFADPLNITEHGKTECIRVNATEITAVVGRLCHNAGVTVQKLQHELVAE
ncbi:Uncharacterised protein [Vibrio cholerae]|nr:Uncharacterised protein [Vibrio cholerae]CSB14294.1 Uncharacterised protein [Vibrio cholerae]CSB17886.1 Uncharacterised protein [Vibrio cholerae]CSB30721.1 Uncharacterised protein [Vibrio cholerae]CSB32287.1 Uncharacterised protein [Vibrio cholerae]